MPSMVYLICSLPSLSFGQAPPLSHDEFTDEARSQLSAKQLGKLNKITIQGITDQKAKGSLAKLANMLGEVQQDETEIRNARRKNHQPNINSLPKAILTDNPLEREKRIMQWQWEELDTIEAGKTFTLTEVLVYKLKLQILIRMQSFNADKGAAVMASIVNPESNSRG